jgi:tRNA(Ile)-lysidine synthase
MPAPLKNNERLLVKLRAGYLRAGASGRRVLLAVSGGGDSMALLDATASLAPALRLRCEVASVDHGLRTEAAAEVALVESESRARRLPFHSIRVAVATGAGLEARAREARYDALQRVRTAAGLELLATAHTASDQAETVLMRLARGASLSGAAAIRAIHGSLIRPMLACTRDEIRSYLVTRGIPFVEDPMNADPAFLRTRIRTEALPALENVAGPGVPQRIARFAELAAEDSELLDAWADAAHRRLRLPDGSLDAVGLRLLQRPLGRRIIARLLTEAGLAVDADLVLRAERALAGERAGVTLARGAILRVEGGRVRIDSVQGRGGASGPHRAPLPSETLASEPLELDGAPVAFTDQGRRLSWTSRPQGARAQPIFASVSGGLVARRRRPGDRVRLPSGRTRKLQDVLTDARIPREERNSLVVLADAEGWVVCVVGVWPKPGVRARSAGTSWLVDAPLLVDRAEAVPVGYKGLAGGR